jgi:hypothetical protein
MEAQMEKRYYGLFEKQAGRWVRLFPELAYRKPTAVRMFQTQLLNGVFSGKVRELRVVPKV